MLTKNRLWNESQPVSLRLTCHGYFSKLTTASANQATCTVDSRNPQIGEVRKHGVHQSLHGIGGSGLRAQQSPGLGETRQHTLHLESAVSARSSRVSGHCKLFPPSFRRRAAEG